MLNTDIVSLGHLYRLAMCTKTCHKFLLVFLAQALQPFRAFEGEPTGQFLSETHEF